jgi:hypothetical protein
MSSPTQCALDQRSVCASLSTLHRRWSAWSRTAKRRRSIRPRVTSLLLCMSSTTMRARAEGESTIMSREGVMEFDQGGGGQRRMIGKGSKNGARMNGMGCPVDEMCKYADPASKPQMTTKMSLRGLFFFHSGLVL